MAYQFIHLDLWSRKADAKGRSTSFIFDEASRKPIACVHVPHPKGRNNVKDGSVVGRVSTAVCW